MKHAVRGTEEIHSDTEGPVRPNARPARLVVGLSGASGIPYGLRLLRVLSEMAVETHLVVTKAAIQTLAAECELPLSQVQDLADEVHDNRDIGAGLASGSFRTQGMIVAPCSAKSLAEIATGIGSSLLSRAADVTLKERRPLVLGLRETPFHLGHIRNMEQVTLMGGIVAPPMPAFYTKPATIDDLINHQVGRWLDLLGLDTDISTRWKDHQ